MTDFRNFALMLDGKLTLLHKSSECKVCEDHRRLRTAYRRSKRKEKWTRFINKFFQKKPKGVSDANVNP